MRRFSRKSFEPIDQEENELMESLENEDWETVNDLEQEQEKAMAAARGTLRKNKRINLRLTEKDYHQIQVKAIEEGIPYQTLISSIVHKYLKNNGNNGVKP
ncbi:MAG: antitoxin [Desulfobacterales bacterium]|nr:antitoxin [Desulfobacterales bacterium]